MHMHPPASDSSISSDTPQLILRASHVSTQNCGAWNKVLSTLCLHGIHGSLSSPSQLTRNLSRRATAEKRHAWPYPHLSCRIPLVVWAPSGPRTSFHHNLLSSPTVSLMHQKRADAFPIRVSLCTALRTEPLPYSAFTRFKLVLSPPSPIFPAEPPPTKRRIR